MACFKSIAVLVLCIIIYVNSTKLAKPLRYQQEELPKRQTKEYVKIKEQAFKELRADVDRLREKNEELESRLDHQDSYNRRADKQFSQVKYNLDKMATMFEQFSTRDIGHNRVSLPVSFSSYLLPEEIPHVPLNCTIVFNHDLVNEQNCYDKTTGIFTAPISGVYMFSFLVYTDFESTSFVELTLDDASVMTAIAESYNMGGNAVVLRVLQGQRVQVKSVENYEFMVNNNFLIISTFSGFLLYV